MRPRIGQLIPWTIALGLALDAGTRLVPFDSFSFRAWEALEVGRGPTGPFEPGRVYVNPLSYGDLSGPQRYAGLRQHHREYFSTDAWGFRNTVPAAADAPVRWLLIGDSFGVGSGVRDDAATFASQLALWSGERVYNASGGGPLPLSDIRFTAARLGMKEGVVIYEYFERQVLTGSTFTDSRTYSSGPPVSARSVSERYRVWRTHVAVSRLAILAGWGWDAIATRVGRVSPVGDDALMAKERPTLRGALANGASMLFFLHDVDVSRDADRQLRPDYFVWLQHELAKDGLELAVLIVPTKYQVYGPLVRQANAPAPHEQPLDRLTAALDAAGVFAVTVTAPLRKGAADSLARNDYVYFIDDTHWNERGIEIAARAFVDAWRARTR